MKRHRPIQANALIGVVAVCLPSVMAGVADAALVAHWSLDDGQSDPGALTATDSVALAADGTWEQDAGGGPIPRWIPGIVGGAAEFGGAGATGVNAIGPGTDDVITISGDGKLDITGALTLSTWIRLEDMGGRNSTRHIVGKDRAGGASQDAYSLKHDMGGFGGDVDTVQFLIASTEINVNLASSMTLTEYTDASQHDGWIHMAGVFEPGQFMRLYIDGVLDAELLAPFVPAEIDSFPATPFNIGRLDNSTTHSFNGRIDEVRMYDHALTLAEIQELATVPIDPGLSPGDFNGDGIVDAADYTVWRDHLGGTMPLPNDDDLGTPIGPNHYSLWKSNFGQAAPGAAASHVTAAVPEPSAAGLVLLALTGLGIHRVRRQGWQC